MAKQQGSSGKREERREDRREERTDDIEEKVLYINRCAKVVKGGRRFSFSALILVGDGKGNVGYGFAKANELTDAIRKGGESARKNMKSFEREGGTIPHTVEDAWDGARVLLKPAPQGTGIVAGSMARAILELGGVKDVVAKNLGSSNPINQVRATFRALASLRSHADIKKMRGVE